MGLVVTWMESVGFHRQCGLLCSVGFGVDCVIREGFGEMCGVACESGCGLSWILVGWNWVENLMVAVV